MIKQKRKVKPHLCKLCGTTNENEFYKGSKGKCKSCAKSENEYKFSLLPEEIQEEIKRDRSFRQKEKANNATKEEKAIKYQKKKAYRSQDFWQMMIYRCDNAKNRAKKKGLEYSINAKIMFDKLVLQKYRCAISGVKLTHYEDLPNTVSFDRDINKVGYTGVNTDLTTTFINNAKASYEFEEFRRLMFEASYYMLKVYIKEKTIGRVINFFRKMF